MTLPSTYGQTRFTFSIYSVVFLVFPVLYLLMLRVLEELSGPLPCLPGMVDLLDGHVQQ